ncbi:Gfo/Idh/MocA family oxidoreductase [Conexibacter arvalis]|uniref:Putative dehydrogenase n=1 Tax=Conexibacter arvalis TaxID=912552 RepID=A0A840IEM6_9ACTN|nr:putative dehydrogenase [Conexibacter arvalis]
MRRLRLGVIGAGSWALSSHLPAFARRADELEFAAVARRGREQLELVRDRYGFAVASEDYRDVLDAGVDVCLIASPTGLHHEHAKAAMEAGAHVLVEKPFTIDPADAWDLVETGERLGRHIVVAFGWNWKPMVRDLHALVARHGIGEVEQVSVQMASVTRALLSNTGAYPDAAPESVPEQATWTDPRLSGGGYAQAQLTHALGLALRLTGLRGEAAFALMSAPLQAPVELHDAIAVRYVGGAIGTVSGGSTHEGAGGDKHQLEVRAIGSKGQLQIDVEREIAWLWTDRGQVDVRLDVRDGDGAYDCEGPPNALLDLALGRDVENHSTGELAARTVELLDAAYRSARTGRLEAVAPRPGASARGDGGGGAGARTGSAEPTA